jgi:hypothetical protein
MDISGIPSPMRMSFAQKKAQRHNLFCGCSEPNFEEKLYAASRNLATEFEAENLTYDSRETLTEGDIVIFNGLSYVFARYGAKYEDGDANFTFVFNDGKEVIYDFWGLWETNNQHRIPYDNVYVKFNKK